MNNKSITKLLETVAFSNGVYVLWNLYDGNIHISIHLALSPVLESNASFCLARKSQLSLNSQSQQSFCSLLVVNGIFPLNVSISTSNSGVSSHLKHFFKKSVLLSL